MYICNWKANVPFLHKTPINVVRDAYGIICKHKVLFPKSLCTLRSNICVFSSIMHVI